MITLFATIMEVFIVKFNVSKIVLQLYLQEEYRMKILNRLKMSLMVVLVIMLLTPVTVLATENEYETVKYVHDPRLNSKAMEDIVVDHNAIYGFRPSNDSTRLAEFASMDWSDPDVVEKGRQERIEYLRQFDTMYDLWNEMLSQGKSTEEIARAVSARRNEVRLASYKNDPEGLERVKKSNLETYGNENGPTPESLFEKYGSWEKVLIKSFSSNSGMDACLGLYDVQYEHNRLSQAIVENEIIVYTVKNNDCLAKIAMKYFGTQVKWQAIYDANEDQIKEKNLIYAGQELIIPLENE